MMLIKEYSLFCREAQSINKMGAFQIVAGWRGAARLTAVAGVITGNSFNIRPGAVAGILTNHGFKIEETIWNATDKINFILFICFLR